MKSSYRDAYTKSLYWKDFIESKLLIYYDLFDNIEVAGSIRRKKSVIGDIDLIVKLKKDINEKIFSSITKDIVSENIKIVDYVKMKNWIRLNVNDYPFKKIDLFFPSVENYYSSLVFCTGSNKLNYKLRKKFLDKNINYRFDKCYDNEKKENISFNSEASLFDFVGMDYIEPEKRF